MNVSLEAGNYFCSGGVDYLCSSENICKKGMKGTTPFYCLGGVWNWTSQVSSDFRVVCKGATSNLDNGDDYTCEYKNACVKVDDYRCIRNKTGYWKWVKDADLDKELTKGFEGDYLVFSSDGTAVNNSVCSSTGAFRPNPADECKQKITYNSKFYYYLALGSKGYTWAEGGASGFYSPFDTTQVCACTALGCSNVSCAFSEDNQKCANYSLSPGVNAFCTDTGFAQGGVTLGPLPIDYWSYMCNGSKTGMERHEKCNKDRACLIESANSKNYQCVYDKDWVWKETTGSQKVNFTDEDKNFYVCMGSNAVVCNEGGGGCKKVSVGGTDYYCFSRSPPAVSPGPASGALVCSDTKLSADSDYNTIVECTSSDYCKFVQSIDASKGYFCDGSRPEWSLATNTGYYSLSSVISTSVTSGPNIACTSRFSGCTSSEDKTGAYCGTSAVPGGPIFKADVDTCSAYLGLKEFVCTSSGWANEYSPDSFSTQCPIPGSPNPTNWTTDAKPALVAGGKKIALEGKCFDEGYASLTITGTAISVQGSSEIYIIDGLFINKSGTTDVVGFVIKEGATTRGYELFDARYDVNGKKIPDFLECLLSKGTGTPGACSVVADGGIIVDSVCVSGNKVNPGVAFNISKGEGENYRYKCEGGVFEEVPYLFFKNPRGSADYRVASSYAPSLGEIGYARIIEDSGRVKYQIIHKLDLRLPNGGIKSDYKISCIFSDLREGLSYTDVITNKEGGYVFDNYYIYKVDGDFQKTIYMTCTVRGPSNRFSISDNDGVWSYTFSLDINDRNTLCDSVDDCLGECIFVGGVSTCSATDVVCGNELTWNTNSPAVYSAVCKACGGVIVSPEYVEGGMMDLLKPYYVQTAPTRIARYSPDLENYNGKVVCSGTGCTAEGSFVVLTSGSTFNISGVTFTKGASLVHSGTACLDDTKDVCSAGRKIIDIEEDASTAGTYYIYSEASGMCLGNQEDEVINTTGTPMVSDVSGTEVFSVLNTSSGFKFSTDASSIAFSYNADTDKWRSTPSPSSNYTASSISGSYHVFVFTRKVRGVDRDILIYCPLNLGGAKCFLHLGMGSFSTVLSDEEVGLQGDGKLVLNVTAGNQWKRVSTNSGDVFNPVPRFGTNSISALPASSFPYDPLRFLADFADLKWPNHARSLTYGVSSASCTVSGASTTLTFPYSDCRDYGNCGISSSIVRETLKNSCSSSSSPGECPIGVSCTATQTVGGISAANSGFLSASLRYSDVGKSCYSSKDCVESCEVNEYVDSSKSEIRFNTIFGQCNANQSGIGYSSFCYAGDYIIKDVLKYSPSDKTFSFGSMPDKIMCDGKIRGSAGNNCDSFCRYTCQWSASRLKLVSPDNSYSTRLELDEELAGCDDPAENYTTCRDCCEAPVGASVGSECGFSDFMDRMTSDKPDFCGIKSTTAYSSATEEIKRTCYASCGAVPACNGKLAGGTECTEWCTPRSSLAGSFTVGTKEQIYDEVLGYLDPSECNSYPVCFSIPYDPHCEKGSCDVTLETGSYPLVVGRTKVTAGNKISFTKADYRSFDPDAGAWRVCTSNGLPVKLIPSETELGGVATATIRYTANLRGYAGQAVPVQGLSAGIDVTVNAEEDCRVGSSCLGASDCENVFNKCPDPDDPLDPEDSVDCPDPVNDTPSCSNLMCIDSDAVGLYFGVNLFENSLKPTSEYDCEFGQAEDCTFDIEFCKAYFLGLELYNVDAGVNYENITINFGGEQREYVLNPYLAQNFLGLPKANGGPIVLPGSISSSGYIFVSLESGDGANIKDGLAMINFVQGSQSTCNSLSDLEGGMSVGDLYSCFYNPQCTDYVFPSGGKVASCLGIDWTMEVNGYSGSTFNFLKVCADTCGIDIDGNSEACDYLGEYKEDPSNCADCCSDYGTGLLTSSEWATTCFYNCEAGASCDGKQVGEIISSGAGLCGLKGGVCGVVSELTGVENVDFGPSARKINVTKSEAPDHSYTQYEFWVYQSDDSFLRFTFDSGMWSGLDTLPSALSYMNDVEIIKDSLNLANGRDVLRVGGETMFDIGNILSGAKYGQLVYDYTVRQMNRLPKKIRVIINPMYNSTSVFSVPLDYKSCFYRKETASGTLCNQPAYSELAIHLSANAVGTPDENAISAECRIGTVAYPVGWTADLSGGVYHAVGTLDFDPQNLPIGRNTASCKVSAPYLYESTATKIISVFGRIENVDAEVPKTVVPGSTYSAYATSVKDEYGNVIPRYTYYWEFVQGGVSVQMGQVDSVAVPRSLAEGPAVLRLTVEADYYEKKVNDFPVNVEIPQQISVSTMPGLMYVPLKGAPRLFMRLFLANSGLDVTAKLKATVPEKLIVNLSATNVNVEGFGNDFVPVTIFVPAASKETDYVVTFSAYVSEKLQDQATFRIIQTEQPIYEFDFGGVLVEDPAVDLIYDRVTFNITLTNVGTVRDSYMITSDLELNKHDVVLEPGDSAEIQATARREGTYQVCFRSIRFLEKPARCLTAEVKAKEVAPRLNLANQEVQIDPTRGGSFVVNMTTAEYSGKYSFTFRGNISVPNYEITLEERMTQRVSVPFTANRSGTYKIEVTAFPKIYPGKSDTKDFTLVVTIPAPYEVQLLLAELEGLGLKDASILASLELAKKMVQDGDYEGARTLLEEIARRAERAITLQELEASARYMKMSRSYTLVVLGGLVIAVGIFLYLK